MFNGEKPSRYSIYLSWDLKPLAAWLDIGSQPSFPPRIITSTTDDTPISSPVRSMKYSLGAKKFTRLLNLTELVKGSIPSGKLT